MDESICLIYDKRPDVCRNWPLNPEQLKNLDKCALSFKDGEVVGECCKCGQCCEHARMIWPDGLTVEKVALTETVNSLLVKRLDEDGKLITDIGCRFLNG